MFGIQAIGAERAYAYRFNTSYNPTGSSRVDSIGRVAAARTTPVPPVTSVPAVQSGTSSATSMALNEPQMPTVREGVDPMEMAVRNRIQYVQDPQTAATAQAETKSAQEVMEEGECQTCKERKYQDGSNDPGVSYKTPTNIDPSQAASAVRGHEQEHVMREQSQAKQENREVVSQSVTLYTDICPECGKVYVSGGTTRTTTRANQNDMAKLFQQPEAAPSLFDGAA